MCFVTKKASQLIYKIIQKRHQWKRLFFCVLCDATCLPCLENASFFILFSNKIILVSLASISLSWLCYNELVKDPKPAKAGTYSHGRWAVWPVHKNTFLAWTYSKQLEANSANDSTVDSNDVLWSCHCFVISVRYFAYIYTVYWERECTLGLRLSIKMHKLKSKRHFLKVTCAGCYIFPFYTTS